MNNNNLFHQLLSVTQFSVTAKAENQWHAKGKGKVLVENPDQGVIVWKETGCWNEDLSNLNFSNVYRWTQFSVTEMQLEHLRYGEQLPVQLVSIIDQGKGIWKSHAPHNCGQDQYHLGLEMQQQYITLDWHIIGPTKNQHSTISYR